MKRHYTLFLKDVLEYADKARLFTSGITFDEFVDDEKTYMATVRALEIIGEAIRHIPETIRNKYPEIPWHQIIGFRNTVIHEYFGIDKKLVWDTLKDDLTFVKEQISGILEDIKKDN